MVWDGLRIYVETSVLSAFYFGPVNTRRLTKRFFAKATSEQYALVTSTVTLDEIRQGPVTLRKRLLSVIGQYNIKIWLASLRVKNLASFYIQRGVIPPEFAPDAEHIAAASILAVDVLATWNLRHIVNLRTKSVVQQINSKLGYKVPQIIRPDEVV